MGRQWSSSCPHFRISPTSLHSFTSVPVSLTCVLGRDVYSELHPDSSSFGGHRKAHFINFVLQKPGPCRTTPCRWTKHTPLPSLSLGSAKRGNTELGLALTAVSLPLCSNFWPPPATNPLVPPQGDGPPRH